MKKITALALILLSFSILASTDAHAMGGSTTGAGGGFMLGVSAMRLATSTSGPTFGDTDNATTIIDVKAVYTLSSGLYFGGIYDTRTDESVGSKNTRTGYGAVLGYRNMGWFIDGAYYINSVYKLQGGAEVKNGTGFGVDVGHNFSVTANVYVGLQVSYKSFTYTKVDAVDQTNKVKSELTPMLNFGVMF